MEFLDVGVGVLPCAEQRPPSPSPEDTILQLDSLGDVNLQEDADEKAVRTTEDSTISTTPAYFSSYSLLNSKALSNKSLLPFGVVFSPCVRLWPNPCTLSSPLPKCSFCSCYLNTYCQTEQGSPNWRCCMCRSLNTFSDLGTIKPAQKVVEFYSADKRLSSQPLQTFAFVLDLNLFASSEFRQCFGIVLERLPQDAYLVLIIFSNTVSLYDVAPGTLGASATVISGRSSPNPEDLRFLMGLDDEESKQDVESVLTWCAPVAKCRDVVLQVLEAVETGYANGEGKGHSRALGAALEASLAAVEVNIQRVGSTHSGQIVVCLSGRPDIGAASGDGATKYYTGLAERARTSSININLFCGGHNSFGVSVLRHLVSGCGGSLFLHESFDYTFATDLVNLLNFVVGSNGDILIAASGGVRVSRVIGHVYEEAKNASSLPSHPNVNFCGLLLTSCRSDHALSIYFDQTDIPYDFVYFQFKVSVDTGMGRKTRVVTRRVRTTGNIATFMGSLDMHVLTVLMLKRSLQQATSGSIEKARSDVKEWIKETGKVFGTREQRKGTTICHMPPELCLLHPILFSALRSPLLGTVFQHPDDQEQLRSCFLFAPVSDSFRVISPTLLSTDGQGNTAEVSLSTLELRSSRLLFLDHHTHVFIWIGSELKDPQALEQAWLQTANESSKHRVPMPKIHSFKEGSSAARWLLCRMTPNHNDAIEDQRTDFPHLTEVERVAVASVLLPTDELSYREFIHSLFSVR